MKNHSARFFCENCNTEVSRDAKFCTNCGHFFASVRCPNCGEIGGSAEFKDGCPHCGYAMDLSSYGIDNAKTKRKKEKSAKNRAGFKDEKLPIWIYVVTISVLIAVILFAFAFYR